MTARKPLVWNNGVEQLQAGDSLLATVTEVDVVTLTNANAGAAVIGEPVYISAAGSFDKARANASGTTKAIGLVLTASIASGVSGTIQKDGTFTATAGQWDTVTGGTGGLTAGSIYYLSEATAGRLTTTAPTSGYILPIGIALSTTDFEISIGAYCPLIKL